MFPPFPISVTPLVCAPQVNPSKICLCPTPNESLVSLDSLSDCQVKEQLLAE